VAAFARTAPDSVIAAECNRLEAIRRQAATGVTGALLREAQAADWAMHDAFMAHLGNRLVAETHRVNSIRIRMILGERIGLSAMRLPVALAEHGAILRAVAARDEAAAVAALAFHLGSSRRRAENFDAAGEGLVREPPPGLNPTEGSEEDLG
jgi:DNA-binding GntR family transcriptional regulator